MPEVLKVKWSHCTSFLAMLFTKILWTNNMTQPGEAMSCYCKSTSCIVTGTQIVDKVMSMHLETKRHCTVQNQACIFELYLAEGIIGENSRN